MDETAQPVQGGIPTAPPGPLETPVSPMPPAPAVPAPVTVIDTTPSPQMPSQAPKKTNMILVVGITLLFLALLAAGAYFFLMGRTGTQEPAIPSPAVTETLLPTEILPPVITVTETPTATATPTGSVTPSATPSGVLP